MPRALLSVTDKSRIVTFAQGLIALRYEVVSTGGTASVLRQAGIPVTDVATLTGFPEMLDGRVKTLHPAIHAGLLADMNSAQHVAELNSSGIAPIDVLCVNLYQFEDTIAARHSPEEAVEAIDIGGPAMIRGAAKNSANVTVVVDPDDYDSVLDHLRAGTVAAIRPALMAKAFRHTAYYDSVIARYFSQIADESMFPDELTIGLRRKAILRYGENPHQQAAYYIDPIMPGGIGASELLSGKELSYNNLLDADAAWELVADLPEDSCAIIKHGNPCGAALGESPAESFCLAREADPVSAFGGVAAFHGPVDAATASALAEKGNFLEVIIATWFDEGAIDIFKERPVWGQSVRLLRAKGPGTESYLTIRSVRSIRGGALVQESDREQNPGPWRCMTRKTPSEDELAALRFQWSIAQHVKSNAIVVGTKGRMLGVGAGQMNRVQSVRLALEQAGEKAHGAVLASDAFFPFPDSVETAAAAGISAIVQPGGSKKDGDVIGKADELGLAMMFTGVRHFRH